MSWTDKEIDKLFTDNASNASFEYKDAYWKEMEAMLPPKKNGGILWLVAPLLFLTLLAFAPVINGRDDSGKKNSLIAKNENSLNRELQHKTIENSDSDNASIKPSIEQKKKSKLENGLADTSTEKNKTYNNHSINKDSRVNHYTGGKVATKKMENTVRPLSKKSTNYQNHKRNDNINNLIDDRKTSNSSTVNSKKNRLYKTDNSNNTETTIEPINNLSTLKTEPIASLQNKELADLIQNLQMPTRTSFFAQALGGLSQSMITPSDRLSYSTGLGIGANFNKGRFVFTTGINGVWSVYDDLVLSRQAKVYDFGSDIFNYELKFKEIYSIEANLSVGYKFGNSTLSIGVRPSYIVGTKVSYRTDELEDILATENYYGYSEGINKLGLKPMLGYSFDFKRGLTIGLNIGTQTIPLLDAVFINGDNNKFPLDAQLYLRKSIKFRK